VVPNEIKTGSSNSSIDPPIPPNFWETGLNNLI